MKHLFLNSITDATRVICNILAFVIPYIIYIINKRLHEYGDPPWKKDQKKGKN